MTSCKQLLTGKIKDAKSFLVKVCHTICIGRYCLRRGEDFRGKSTSRREYFNGYEVALLISEAYLPIEVAFIPGSYVEQSALARLDFDLLQGKIVWKDNGFTDYAWEDFYTSREQIEFASQGKKTSQRGTLFHSQNTTIKNN